VGRIEIVGLYLGSTKPNFCLKKKIGQVSKTLW
jgi:hypothetical protein